MRALIELGGLGARRAFLDVGAGTGDIGIGMVRAGVEYIGLDGSGGMLDVFRRNAASLGLAPDLRLADATLRWPLADSTFAMVFGSRSLHWIDPEHLVTEAERVASADGALLVIGRVERDPSSPRGRIRSEMRRLLSAAGFDGRSGNSNARAVVFECERRGMHRIERRTVASYRTVITPELAVRAWRDKAGLSGADVPADVKATILERVLRYTAAEFGDNDAELESEEHYTLEGAVLRDGPGLPHHS